MAALDCEARLASLKSVLSLPIVRQRALSIVTATNDSVH
jgi:hypothetical protein